MSELGQVLNNGGTGERECTLDRGQRLLKGNASRSLIGKGGPGGSENNPVLGLPWESPTAS